jgi:hypothetical protein
LPVSHPVEVVHLLLEQQPRGGGEPLGDPDGGGVRAVGGAEGVVDVEVGQRGELLGELGIVLRLARIEAAVFQEHDAPPVPIIQGLLHLRSDGGVELEDGLAEQLFEAHRDGVHRVLFVRLALGPAEV